MSQTNRQLAGNQRRTLRAIRERLLVLAAEWYERDQFNHSALAEVADKVEEVAAQLVDDSGTES